MLGIGFTEMIVIAGIALVVIGPEKFPEFAKIFVRVVSDIRTHWDDIKREVTSELKPIDRELKQLAKYDPENYLKSLSTTAPPKASTIEVPGKESEIGVEPIEAAPVSDDTGETDSAVETDTDDVWDKDMGPYPYSGDIVAQNLGDTRREDTGSTVAPGDDAAGEPESAPEQPEKQ